MAGFFDRHRVLAHGLEQRRLGAWRRAVDLVGKDNIRKERSLHELELAPILAIDRDADDVRRQRIRCELDTVKIEVEGTSEGLGKGRFPDTWHILEEHVAASEQGRNQGVDDLGLAANDTHDRFVQTLEAFQDCV